MVGEWISVDVVNIFRGKISGSQLFKNVAETTSAVAGGTAGWVGGATAGAAIGSVVPIVGTALSGFIGGLAGAFGGGSLASRATSKVLDNFIEDDADKMLKIIESVFVEMVKDYLLTEHEVEDVVDYISHNITGKSLKDMYASNDRMHYTKMLILPYIEQKAAQREHIKAIGAEGLQRGLWLVLEDIADSEEYKNSVQSGDLSKCAIMDY